MAKADEKPFTTIDGDEDGGGGSRGGFDLRRPVGYSGLKTKHGGGARRRRRRRARRRRSGAALAAVTPLLAAALICLSSPLPCASSPIGDAAASSVLVAAPLLLRPRAAAQDGNKTMADGNEATDGDKAEAKDDLFKKEKKKKGRNKAKNKNKKKRRNKKKKEGNGAGNEADVATPDPNASPPLDTTLAPTLVPSLAPTVAPSFGLTPELTSEPTFAPSRLPTTPQPSTASPTKAPSTAVLEGTMEVNIIVGLYNGKGLTAQDVLNGAQPTDASFPYRNFIEAALGFVWKTKFPNARRRRMTTDRESDEERSMAPRALACDPPRQLGGFDGCTDAEISRHDEEEDGSGPFFDNLAHYDFLAAAEPDLRFDPHLRRRYLQTLEIKLAFNANLTDGLDVDCPDFVPPGTMSGAVNTCQNFTATLTVQAVGLLRSSVTEEVVRVFNEAERDGNLTKELYGIDGSRTFRVRNDQVGRGVDPADGGGGDPSSAVRYGGGDGGGTNTAAIIGGVVGVVVLLCCCVGVFIYCRRRRGNGGKVEGENVDEQRKTEAEDFNADENTGYDNL